jgi:hypothetical protein
LAERAQRLFSAAGFVRCDSRRAADLGRRLRHIFDGLPKRWLLDVGIVGRIPANVLFESFDFGFDSNDGGICRVGPRRGGGLLLGEPLDQLFVVESAWHGLRLEIVDGVNSLMRGRYSGAGKSA